MGPDDQGSHDVRIRPDFPVASAYAVLMQLDPDHCYSIIQAHDSRFDGVFFVGVSTTGIYCRPVCRVRTPGRDRCRFFPNAAQAESAGFRPCLRCRPELAPGMAPMDRGPRLADQAFARIRAGALNHGSLEGLAADLAVSSRQLRRVLEQRYGVGPSALAQTQRLHLAKQLIAETSLSMADIAFSAGFGSVRRFNALFQEHYRLNPSELRREGKRAMTTQASAAGTVNLRLAYRPPLAWDALSSFLASRGATGVEARCDGVYLRSMRMGKSKGWICVRNNPQRDCLEVELSSSLLPALPQVLAKLRELFDLDASPEIIAEHLRADPKLRPLITKQPGLRVPGCIDGFELALRAVIGQQVSVAAATTVFARCVQRFGDVFDSPHAQLTYLAPRAEALASADVSDIAALGMPGKRAETIRLLAQAVADGRLQLDAAANREETQKALLALPGIGPWTVAYIAMRALRESDAFPASDLGLIRGMGYSKAADLLEYAERWRPWRAYAALHIWSAYGAGG